MSTPASFVTLEEDILTANPKKKTHAIFGTLCVFVALAVIVKFIIYFWGREDEIIHDVGVSLPETWYYNRTMMSMPLCQEDEGMVREEVLIGYVDRNCSDVESCVATVRTIHNQANFFIAIGHVFEGYGWKCNVTDRLNIKFIGFIDWAETLLYYVLLKDGIADHEMSPKMRILIDKNTCNKDACTPLLSLGAPPSDLSIT